MTDQLQKILIGMTTYGRPYVHCGSSLTWSVSLDAHVNSAGVELKIGSDHGHKTPLSAAQQCQERLEKALITLQSRELKRLNNVAA